jgi:hypothetical protein
MASRAGSPNASVIRENPDCIDCWTRAIETPGQIIAHFRRHSFQNLMKRQGEVFGDSG